MYVWMIHVDKVLGVTTAIDSSIINISQMTLLLKLQCIFLNIDTNIKQIGNSWTRAVYSKGRAVYSKGRAASSSCSDNQIYTVLLSLQTDWRRLDYLGLTTGR